MFGWAGYQWCEVIVTLWEGGDLKDYKPVLLEIEKLERQLVSQRENSVSSTRRYWCRVGVAWPGGLGTRTAVRESIKQSSRDSSRPLSMSSGAQRP